MKQVIALAVALLCGASWMLGVRADEAKQPLRVFIRAGEKTHGPGQHDSPRFLKEWVELLNARGAKAEGAKRFPTAEELARTDVLVLYCANGGDVKPQERADLDVFLKRGGGIVVIHDAICSNDPDWWQSVVGGAWQWKKAKYLEGRMGLYFQDRQHPITKGAENFFLDDELYYELNMEPDAHVLASAFHDVFKITPQMWTYEKGNYRAFVTIQAHNWTTFELPHFRALLLRGISWAGKRPDVDELVTAEEKKALRWPKDGPTPPEEAVKKIHAPDGFELNLIAAEPLITKPISMEWDVRGRMWIAETPEYPFHQDKTRTASDRISILSDPDEKGRYQKKTVFADGLNLVTSLVLYKDGVLVAQAPDVLWLRDTDGDGKADKREVLFTGFGTRDTHAVISNFRWGMDGWVYATVGYSQGNPTSGDGTRSFGKITDGVWRFRPDGSACEQVCSKNSNTWGCDFAADGELFFSQANGNHVDHVVLPERILAKGRIGSVPAYKIIEDHKKVFPAVWHPEQPYIQYDFIGGFTAAAGCMIYTGGSWPAEYEGQYFVSEPTVHVLHRDVIKPDPATGGVTFVASKAPGEEEKEFVAGTDLWFRPIHQRVGPDGDVYLLDFYNQAILHNDPRRPPHGPGNAAVRPDRDHEFGRIWRIHSRYATTLPELDLSKTTPAELVAALEHPNRWQRMTAQRMLVERGDTSVAGDLEKLVAAKDKPWAGRVHALWTLSELGKLTPAALAAAVRDGEAAVRKNALWVAEAQGPSADQREVWAAVLERLSDSDARVRIAALAALTKADVSADVAERLIELYPKAIDPWTQSAVAAVANRAPLEVIAAAMDAKEPAALASLVNAVAGRSAADVELLAKVVMMAAGKAESANPLKRAVLEGIAKEASAQSGNTPRWSEELKNALAGMLRSGDQGVAGASLQVIAAWDKDKTLAAELAGVISQMKASLGDSRKADADRLAAAQSLVRLRQLEPGGVAEVSKLLKEKKVSPSLRKGLIEALGDVDDPAVGRQLVDALPGLPVELRPVAVNELLRRPERAMLLLDTIQSGTVQLATLGPDAVYRLRTYPNSPVALRARKIIDALRGPETRQKDELIAKFRPTVEQKGDVANGKKLFTANCAVCHSFKGEGRGLAPDLTGMGAHGPAALLIDVLDPNRSVEANFLAWDVFTNDGQSYSGIIAQENATSVLLRNSIGDVEVKVANIKRRRNQNMSLMPEGFESLGPEALRDILSYICADQAKYRIVDLRPAFTANSTRGIYTTEQSTRETLAFAKFGVVQVGEVPFEVMSPTKSPTGGNVIVLQGGPSRTMSRRYPRSVEAPVGLAVSRFHILGGVGGWASPLGPPDEPVMKLSVRYKDGQQEETVLRNGKEFADYNGNYDVPGSKAAPGIVTRGQVRYLTVPVKRGVAVESLKLESFGNGVAPTIVAITAELAEPGGK